MALFAAKNRATDWLALSLLPDRIEVAQVERGHGGRPAVHVCDSYGVRGSALETLRRLRKSLRASRFQCSALLQAGEYQMQLVEAPSVPAEELRSAVRWKLKDLLDYPVDAATVDVADVPSDNAGAARPHYVYAVSARNDRIASRMKLFHDAGFALHAIDVPEMAQRNIAALFEEPGRGLAMLAFDERGGLLTFTSGGELYMARQTDISLSQLTSLTAGARESVLDRLVLELQRSLDHFDRQFSYITLSRLLLAPLPVDLGVQEYLAENLYVPVQTFDLSEVLDFPGTPELRDPERQSFRLQLIGGALRETHPE
jgi:Tfp pilus assembly PilM family ATPase